MAGKIRRKGKPYDPANPVHDRRSHDLVRGAQVSPIEVDDPMELGGKLMVMRSTRNDPLAALHARKHIDEAQYQGGRAFQDDFETIEGGAKAVDPSQPYVDCSRVPRGVSMAYSAALVRLNKAHKAFGQDGSGLMHDLLIEGMTYRQIAAARGYGGERWEKFFGMLAHLHLHKLSYVYGFATEPTGKRRHGESREDIHRSV